VNALRRRQQRNFLATLFLSQGVPMLLGGDELSRTQHGNNNAWCQDNELSWFDWELGDDQRELLEFTRRLIFMRRHHPVFRRRRFLQGVTGSGLPDVWWFRPDGRRMTRRDWEDGRVRWLGMFLNGDELHETTSRGEPIGDESFLLLFNAHHEPVTFQLPARRFGARWKLDLSTAEPHAEERSFAAREPVELKSRSLVVLRRGW
jgi:glycogen operon protein